MPAPIAILMVIIKGGSNSYLWYRTEVNYFWKRTKLLILLSSGIIKFNIESTQTFRSKFNLTFIIRCLLYLMTASTRFIFIFVEFKRVKGHRTEIVLRVWNFNLKSDSVWWVLRLLGFCSYPAQTERLKQIDSPVSNNNQATNNLCLLRMSESALSLRFFSIIGEQILNTLINK